MSADIVSACWNRISEEVPCAWRTSRNTGTWIDPGIDRRRAGLKCPLRCRFADAMITQAVHQRILVVNPMWFWRRIRREAAKCVVPKVVIPRPWEEGEPRPIRILEGRDDQVIPESHRLGPGPGCSAGAPVYSHSRCYIQCVVVNLNAIQAASIPGADVDFPASFFGTVIDECSLGAVAGANVVAED